VLDLNGNTFFSGNTIYLGPKTTIRGSGCFIAVGNITFQPNLGSAGDKLVGVDYTTSFNNTAEIANTLLLSKFTAEHNGFVKTFSLLCKLPASGNVKLAMYAADLDTGEPTTLMRTTDNLPSATASMPVGSGLNGSELHDIDFPETRVEAGKSYWLAAISDTAVIGYKTFTSPDTWESKTKTEQTYSNFTFTETLTGLTTVTDKQYLLAGNALPFLFVMSITGSSDIKPGGTLYGSIAGNAEVELFPGNTLTLTDVPEAGLDFPGPDTSTDDTGTPATIRTYTIK
jgi:hypothetical protein